MATWNHPQACRQLSTPGSGLVGLALAGRLGAESGDPAQQAEGVHRKSNHDRHAARYMICQSEISSYTTFDSGERRVEFPHFGMRPAYCPHKRPAGATSSRLARGWSSTGAEKKGCRSLIMTFDMTVLLPNT